MILLFIDFLIPLLPLYCQLPAVALCAFASLIFPKVLLKVKFNLVWPRAGAAPSHLIPSQPTHCCQGNLVLVKSSVYTNALLESLLVILHGLPAEMDCDFPLQGFSPSAMIYYPFGVDKLVDLSALPRLLFPSWLLDMTPERGASQSKRPACRPSPVLSWLDQGRSLTYSRTVHPPWQFAVNLGDLLGVRGHLGQRNWLDIHSPLPGFSWAHLLLFSCSVTSNSFQPHGLEHSRLPFPSLSPGACSNSCLSSQWCHPMSSSSVIPFSSCP